MKHKQDNYKFSLWLFFSKRIYNAAVNFQNLQFYKYNSQKLIIFRKGMCFIIAIFALY